MCVPKAFRAILTFLVLHSQLILTSLKKDLRESTVISAEKAYESLEREALSHCVGVARTAARKRGCSTTGL